MKTSMIVQCYFVFISVRPIFKPLQSRSGPFRMPLLFHYVILFQILMQISLGYFMSDLAMILWNYPALGGMEYVSTIILWISYS